MRSARHSGPHAASSGKSHCPTIPLPRSSSDWSGRRQHLSGAAIRREEAALLRRAMAELKPRDYEIITMRVFDDLTFPEIGKILGEPENTVTQRYHRALHKLLVKLIKPEQDETEAVVP